MLRSSATCGGVAAPCVCGGGGGAGRHEGGRVHWMVICCFRCIFADEDLALGFGTQNNHLVCTALPLPTIELNGWDLVG